MNAQDKIAWSVTLTPHRSLDGPAFKILFGWVILLNLIIAVFFYRLGAWPVFGFLGLDVALVWWAFKANTKAAERSERITITGDDLRLIKQMKAHPPTEMQFNRRWVRIVLEYDAARELVGRLLLVSSGKATEIASFLGAEERESLAAELKRAIASPKI
jgi:uncharacterized membrane protein